MKQFSVAYTPVTEQSLQVHAKIQYKIYNITTKMHSSQWQSNKQRGRKHDVGKAITVNMS